MNNEELKSRIDEYLKLHFVPEKKKRLGKLFGRRKKAEQAINVARPEAPLTQEPMLGTFPSPVVKEEAICAAEDKEYTQDLSENKDYSEEDKSASIEEAFVGASAHKRPAPRPAQAPPCPMPSYGASQGAARKASQDVAAKSHRRGLDISRYVKDRYKENALATRLNLYMYERDITTAMIYERCFVDRKLISKITTGSGYHPSKTTMLALCIGLRLSISESEDFLSLAGYSFSSGSKSDLIIKYMLEEEIYDIDTVNDMLDEFGQTCIGA